MNGYANGYFDLFLQTGNPLFYTMAKEETPGACRARGAAERSAYGG